MKLFRKKQVGTPARRSSALRSDLSKAGDLEQRYAFRRNRTLTGSLSSEVDSATLHQVELRSTRVQSHDLKSHRRKIAGMLGGVMLGVVCCGYLVFQSIATPIAFAETTRPIDKAHYQQKIEAYLREHPLQRLRSTVDTVALGTYMQQKGAPEIVAVSPVTTYAGFGKSSFTLAFRQPVVVWNTGARTFYVDATGAAFERNYFAEPTVQVVDKTGIEAKGSQVLASNRFLGFIGKIIGHMQTEGFTVTQVALPEDTTRQIQISLEGVSYSIKFSVDRLAGEQGEDAVRAMKHFSSNNITPQYLDVRVSGKAYYQ